MHTRTASEKRASPKQHSQMRTRSSAQELIREPPSVQSKVTVRLISEKSFIVRVLVPRGVTAQRGVLSQPLAFVGPIKPASRSKSTVETAKHVMIFINISGTITQFYSRINVILHCFTAFSGKSPNLRGGFSETNAAAQCRTLPSD